MRHFLAAALSISELPRGVAVPAIAACLIPAARGGEARLAGGAGAVGAAVAVAPITVAAEEEDLPAR